MLYFILCKPSWNKTMFINPEMLQIDSFGYSILLEIYGKIGAILRVHFICQLMFVCLFISESYSK